MNDQQNKAVIEVVDGRAWTLEVTANEPRIRDIDLAERAGLKQPCDIREAIERSRAELQEYGLLDMRVHCTRISKPRGGFEEREVTEFWLNEHQATSVLLLLRTAQARRLRVTVVKVFIAIRRGLLPAPQQVPVLSTSPVIGGTQFAAELRDRCAMFQTWRT